MLVTEDGIGTLEPLALPGVVHCPSGAASEAGVRRDDRSSGLSANIQENTVSVLKRGDVTQTSITEARCVYCRAPR